MRLLQISDNSSGLTASISPEYGDMPVFIGMGDGGNILRVDDRCLGSAPMLAGGMPVLFPFASRTRNDCYLLNGRTYHMPFHGLVKNAAFAVQSASDSAVTVWIDRNAAQKQWCYPFDFRLEMTYTVRNGVFEAEAAVSNLSDIPMPHSLGWHPFFIATDKKTLTFTHHMRGHYDYTSYTDSDAPGYMDLSQAWDDVLISPQKREFVLKNIADRYVIRGLFDDGHNALVVCTTTDRSVCIEPWCGIPDSINNGRFLQWIDPGMTARYRFYLHISSL